MTDLQTEGHFIWEEIGKYPTYTAFNIDEPNDRHGVEECVMLWGHRSLNWNDSPCGTAVNAICEFPTSDQGEYGVV